jgi:hypothetical protein
MIGMNEIFILLSLRMMQVGKSIVKMAWITFLIGNAINSRAFADDLELKKRYFRLHMEYQNVELSGTIKVNNEYGSQAHDFILRYGQSRGGRVPPMEVFTLRPNPGEPHIQDELLIDEAFAMTDEFVNLHFRREYISAYRYGKFFGAPPEARSKARTDKALRFSYIYLMSTGYGPPPFFYYIHEAVQMGLDGHDTKVYWGNESKYEQGSKFEILGEETFLDYPCLRVRYRDLQGITIEALIATTPTLQILKVFDVTGPPSLVSEDSKSIWMNLPKTESLKRFDRWLVRDRVSYQDRDVSWEVTIKDVKPLSDGYSGLWSTYNSMTGVRLSGPAEPQTRNGTARVPVKESKGYMMVPYTDEEMKLITKYLEKEYLPMERPRVSLVRVASFAVFSLAMVGIVIILVRRYRTGK